MNKNDNIFTEYFIYCTRSFPFSCRYKTLLSKLAESSTNINTKDGVFLSDNFIKNFLNYDNTSSCSKVVKYEFIKSKSGKSKKPSIHSLAKNDYILFLLKPSLFINQLKSKEAKNVIKDNFKKLLTYVDLNINDLAKSPNLNKSLINIKCKEFLKKLENTEYDLNSDDYFSFYSILEPLKKDTCGTISSLYFVEKVNDVFKIANKIRDYFDVLECFDDKIKILAVACKSGVLNISLFKTNSIGSELPHDYYDPNNQNYLIKEATDKAKIIQTISNRLPKSFSFLNLNSIFGSKFNNLIFDNPNQIIFPHSEDTKISNKISTNKGIYLRFIVDNQFFDKNDTSPMIYYDYFTLLVAFQHSYDENTLWKFVNDSEKNGPSFIHYNKIIHDYLLKPTEHMYFDNSLVTLSVIDESININEINNKIENIGKKIEKSEFSHCVRIYSFWDFLYICNSLCFGSISLMVNKFLLGYIKEIVNNTTYKPFLNLRLARLSAIFARIDARHNHTSFSNKEDSNFISDIVFDRIGLIRSENHLEDATARNWRSGNLISTQTYQRYGLLFSFIGLLTGLFSYGLISLVDISKNSKSTYCGLFKDIFTESPKIPVVLTIIAAPVVVWLIFTIIDSIILNKYANNIFKLSKYHKNKKA